MDLWRQTDIVSKDAMDGLSFILIGAGGIGSVVGLILVKMGVTDLTVYDPDVIEEHNIPNQTYRLSDVGRPKVEALAEVCRDFAGVEIKTRQEMFTDSTLASGVVISGVDSMESRMKIWRTVRYNPRALSYIEGRMGAQEGRVYTVTPHDPDQVRLYEATLHGDAEAEELPCTARSIAFNCFYLAGLLVSQVKKVIMGEEVALEVIFDLVTTTLIVPR